jgi:hypothetical protein
VNIVSAGILTGDGALVSAVANPLPIANGGTGAANQPDALTAILGASVIPTANGGTGATSGPDATRALGTTYRLLGVIKNADFNSIADQPIIGFPSKWIPRRIVAQNASISMTSAAGGLYTGAGKTGIVIVPASQVYSSLTTAGAFLDLTLDTTAGGPTFVVLTATTIFFALTSAQGVAATGDIYIWGEDIS